MPLIDLLFPRRCPVCGDIVCGKALIHEDCRKKLILLKEPVCSLCGRELASSADELCERCRRGGRAFDRGRALLLYNETAMASMSAVKYKNKREYLDFYAFAMTRRFEHFVKEEKPDVLIPVPIHPARMRSRGFNQSRELAVRPSKAWDIPVCDDLLKRVKNTDPLKGMGAAERKEHLKGAFDLSLKAGGDIPKRTLLIDDICTTGSTLEACAKTLKAGGVKRVAYLTICMGYAR